MRKNKSPRLAVSGSLAYDQIMDFPGCFSDHILPNQIHNLNLSFLIGALRRSFGGTAGNIAYNLTLLKEKPIILGVVGSDFLVYEKWLKKNGADLSQLAAVSAARTAAAYIITDQKDNQIAAFYPGPKLKNYARRVTEQLLKRRNGVKGATKTTTAAKAEMENIALAIIAPDDKSRMLAYAAVYKKNWTPYIFDPGQVMTVFSAAELRQAINGAKVLIGNDYEIKLIGERLKINLKALAKMVEILVVTKGGEGSEIYQGKEKIIVKPAKPKNTCDPTGAGDAYRAGLMAGLINGYNLKSCGQLAGLVAVYTVEKFGTQTHRFTLAELRKRYYENFGEKLDL